MAVAGSSGCEALIAPLAAKYGLNKEMTTRLYETLKYESAGWTAFQSEVIDPNGPNGRENSWGCAQIHLTHNPHVTKEEALDPYFAVSFAAKHFASGDTWMWTAYRILYK
jgi:hypothetical protein